MSEDVNTCLQTKDFREYVVEVYRRTVILSRSNSDKLVKDRRPNIRQRQKEFNTVQKCLGRGIRVIKGKPDTYLNKQPTYRHESLSRVPLLFPVSTNFTLP